MKHLHLYLVAFLLAVSVGALVPSKVSADVALVFGNNSGVPQVIKSTNNALWVTITGGSSTVSNVSASDTNGIALKSYLNPVDGTNFTPALAGAGAGNVNNGVHSYKFTLTDVNGETTAGAATPTVNVVDKTVNGKVTVKIPLLSNSSQVNSIKLYRTIAGGSTYLFLAEVTTLTAGTYTDNTADSGLGAAPPSTNTAFGTRYTLLGEYLLPTIGVGNSAIPQGNVFFIGDPRSDTQLQNAIAVHDAFTPTSRGVELDIYAGNSRGGAGGPLSLFGGNSATSTGGAVNVSGGNGSSSANSGKVILSSANKVELGAGLNGTKITDGGSGYGTLDLGTLQASGSPGTTTTVLHGNASGVSSFSAVDLQADVVNVWTARTFTAGDFTASTGTWTLQSGDQQTFKYIIVGKQMTVALWLDLTTLSNDTANLIVLIPAGKTAVSRMATGMAYLTAGTTGSGRCLVLEGDTHIYFQRDANVPANFTAGTNNTSVTCTLTFEIQ